MVDPFAPARDAVAGAFGGMRLADPRLAALTDETENAYMLAGAVGEVDDVRNVDRPADVLRWLRFQAAWLEPEAAPE